MKRVLFAAILVLSLPVEAQTDKSKSPPPAPVITDAQKAQFFKAQSFTVQASTQAEKTQAVFQGVIDGLKKVCGDSYDFQTNQSGDPVCVAKSPSIEKK